MELIIPETHSGLTNKGKCFGIVWAAGERGGELSDLNFFSDS